MAEEMSNAIKNYISSCNYLVYVDEHKMGFSKISNLTMTVDTETFKEGGSEAPVCVVKKKEGNNEILTLEKGISEGVDKEVMWFLTPGCQINNILIIIKNSTEVKKVFNVERGTVTKVSYSNLDAASSNILMVTLQVSHSGVKELNTDAGKKYIS